MWETSLGYCIYKGHGGSRVYQNLFYRWLTFNSPAIQSVINIRHPERPVLKYLALLCQLARMTPGNTCLLGLGGAGAAHYLAPFMNDFKLIAVDNDAEVIALAEQFFMSGLIKPLNVIHQDALAYLKGSKIQFKHLLVDLYKEEGFPEGYNTIDFFNQCFLSLEDHGFLSVNIANPEEQYSIYSKIKACFNSNTVVLPVKGSLNMIIVASKHKHFSFLLDQLNKGSKIKQSFWDPRLGCIVEMKS